MENFVKYCKDYILEHLDEYKDASIYMCDFPYDITYAPNANGTLTFDRAEAVEYLREWFYEAGMYWQWENDNFGKVEHNPFDNPEAYMVCMVIEGVAAILSWCPIVQKEWDGEKTVMDDSIISEIREYVLRFDETTELF